MNMAMKDPIAKLFGNWSSDLTIWSIILRIILTVIFSFFIGYERSRKRHSAGLRTFMLISLASCVSMILDLYIVDSTIMTFSFLSVATIIGTAMLSGNSILFSSKKQIKGLTTSAGLWVSCFLGLITGAGLYVLAIVLFAALLLSLALLPRVEVFLKNRSNHFEVHLELKDRNDLQKFVATLRKLQLQIDDIELNSAYIGSGICVYTIAITIKSREQLKKYKNYGEIIEALRSLDYVAHIEEIK